MTDGEELVAATPTLVEAIRRCGLAVHLSRKRRWPGGESPSNPYARLGSAVHRVLAWAAGAGPTGLDPARLETTARSRWREEVAIEEEAAARFAVERFFGPAERWPGFASTEERLVIEVGRLVAEVTAAPGVERWIERPLRSQLLSLRGSPDLVVLDGLGARIVDFKSGHVGPEDAEPTGRYGRQVLLYAAMVRELGMSVIGAELRPIGRPRLNVEVTDATIDAASGVAAEALSMFNAAVSAGKPSQLARPGDRACSFCPHALYCPALWTEGGLASLVEFQALEGAVLRVQQATLGVVAIELYANVGTSSGAITITGLDPRRIPSIGGLAVGDEVRVSGVHLVRQADIPLKARPGPWVQLERVSALEALTA
jgi:hypothetical protein